MAEIKDDVYHYIDDDIQKIQVKTNMYINEYGRAGTFHLAREIAQNNFDECLSENSPGKHIEITYDRATDILRCVDDGRSFNESQYDMKIFCTTIQSGSKFFRSGGASSAGEFGVGMSVVNALSDYFMITAYRKEEGTTHTIEFHEGVLVRDEWGKNKKGISGTVVEFRVSEKYMGSDAELPIEDFVNWVEKLFYLDSERLKKKGITCKIDIYNGLKLENTYKLKAKPFAELLDKLIPAGVKKSQLLDKVSFDGEVSFIEDTKTLVNNDNGTTSVEMTQLDKVIHMDIAFTYNTSADMNEIGNYDTYCNYTNTIENGVHLSAFDEAYCRYMQNKVNESMSDIQKNKLKVTWDDIRTNLIAIINLSTNAYVGFVGNAKEKIGNKDLIPYMKDIITNGLEEFFSKNQSVLNDIVKLIKLNAKARLEAIKAKVATHTERYDRFDELTLKNFIPANNVGKAWKEINLVEGESAGGSARNGSDPDTQAFLLLKGVVANPFKCTLTEIMNNAEWKAFVNIIRTGIGKNFDINKLYYDRINILTDADIDGLGISGGILAFIYLYMRPLIEQGKVYKVLTPLYALDDKENPYAINKAKLVEIYQKKLAKNYKIKLNEHKADKFSKAEFEEFLMDTYDYAENLMNASKRSGNINKYFIEMVGALLVISGKVRSEEDFDDIDTVFADRKFRLDMLTAIHKVYEEITVDEKGRFSGVIDGKAIVLKISPRFYMKIADLIPVYMKYGYILRVSEKDRDYIRMSIGTFFDQSMKYLPKIITRFKGLGELNGKQLFNTALNINNRISIQYTVEDAERELDIFKMTHGTGKDNLEKRKAMMKAFKIKRDDLDN